MPRRREDRKTERQEDRPPGEIVTVALTDMAQTGEAIGRVDGVVLFVPFGMPGDRAEVLVTERKRTFARGQLLRLVEPAPDRVTPSCPISPFVAAVSGSICLMPSNCASKRPMSVRT